MNEFIEEELQQNIYYYTKGGVEYSTPSLELAVNRKDADTDVSFEVV